MDPTLKIDSQYMLPAADVHIGEDVGRSPNATVLEIQYMGLKCAGKKLLSWLTKKGTQEVIVSRFEEECRILSQVRHPNIVQFLGLYFEEGRTAPIMVMEYLPINLTSCIERYGRLPQEIGYSILHDVALGLCYLHCQNPPIIHRNLHSNNILLTSNMTAKISDLGMARILKDIQASNTWTQEPANPHFMPPEAQIAHPNYDASTDVFSYGIVMIHVLSGKYPEPQVPPNKMERGKLVAVPEADRRQKFLEAIGKDHPLNDLIRNCIFFVKESRPKAREIEKKLGALLTSTSLKFHDQMEMLIQKFSDVISRGQNGNKTLLPEEIQAGKGIM